MMQLTDIAHSPNREMQKIIDVLQFGPDHLFDLHHALPSRPISERSREFLVIFDD